MAKNCITCGLAERGDEKYGIQHIICRWVAPATPFTMRRGAAYASGEHFFGVIHSDGAVDLRTDDCPTWEPKD